MKAKYQTQYGRGQIRSRSSFLLLLKTKPSLADNPLCEIIKQRSLIENLQSYAIRDYSKTFFSRKNRVLVLNYRVCVEDTKIATISKECRKNKIALICFGMRVTYQCSYPTPKQTVVAILSLIKGNTVMIPVGQVI